MLVTSQTMPERRLQKSVRPKSLPIVVHLLEFPALQNARTAIEYQRTGLAGVQLIFVSFRNPIMRKHMLCLMLGAAVVGCADPSAEGPTTADPPANTGGGEVTGAQLVKFTCPTMT